MTSKDNLNPEPTQLENVSGERNELMAWRGELISTAMSKEQLIEIIAELGSDLTKTQLRAKVYLDLIPPSKEALETISNQQSDGGDNLPMSNLTNKEN